MSGEQSCHVGKRLRNKADAPRPPTPLSTSTTASLREHAHSSAKVGLKPRHKKHPWGLDRTPVPRGPLQSSYLWKRCPQGSFLAACMESQQMAQSSLLTASSSGVATANLGEKKSRTITERSWQGSVSAPCADTEHHLHTDITSNSTVTAESHSTWKLHPPKPCNHVLLFRDHQRTRNLYTETDCVVTQRPLLMMTWANISGHIRGVKTPQRAKLLPWTQKGCLLISNLSGLVQPQDAKWTPQWG